MKLSDLKTQVLVVGSGSAGISSAIASARNGDETLLIEYHGFLGGILATLPWLGFHDRDYRQVVKGFADEVIKKMHALGAFSDYVYDPKCSSLVSINSHSWKIMAIRLSEEAVTVMRQPAARNIG